MKKILTALILSSIILIIGGCSSDEEETPHFLDVDLQVNPEQANPGDEIVMEAKVTYGGENVTDANKVTFEIWRADSDEKHEKIEVEHAGEGIYRLVKTFEIEGTYYVISHVTARDMHNMPKKEFVVGKPSVVEEESETSQEEEEEESNH